MANIIPNASLGRGLPLVQQVEDNSPAAAVLRLHVWDGTGAVDNDVRDADDGAGGAPNVDDIEAVTNVDEVTNTGYPATAPPLDEGDITITVDNTNDRTDVILVDYTYTSISAGDEWTDLSLCYDDDGADTDANNPVLYWWDFVVTPNGGDITVDFPATAVIRYEQA